MHAETLLVELFVEELPPKALKRLGEAFAEGIAQGLVKANLLSDGKVTGFASPRRLGVLITRVSASAPAREVTQKLMPVAVGLDANGNATPALLKRLAAVGADVSDPATVVASLKRQPDGKAEALFYTSTVPGATLGAGLQAALDETLAKLPIPKLMSYQLETGIAKPGWDSVSFVRPAHGLVALHGSEILPIQVLGLHAGRSTQGHRFEATKATLTLTHANDYEATLERDGAVIPSFAKRRAEIVKQLRERAPQHATPIDDEALLDEVTALVERPNVLVCSFEREFLTVPQECLILTMKANQKYFPLLDGTGKLTHQFLVVSNITPADASLVIQGNERVVRPRLADAKFFFDQDRKKSLAARVSGLDKVVYHGQLGTQGARVERVRMIARAIAAQLGGDGLVQSSDQAAQLAKADLLTDMVGEFPELQGIMGGYYALNDALGEPIAHAIEDHYKPRFAGDALPRNEVGIVVALADKLETLTGLFGIGQVPTGDKDPFALRRHALGLIRMLRERALPLDLNALLALARSAFTGLFALDSAQLVSALPQFIDDRLNGVLREQGASAQEVDAVLALKPQRLADIDARLAAVRAFATRPEAQPLAAANKRINNILKKAEGPRAALDKALLTEAAEEALYTRLLGVTPDANARYAAGDYTGMLQVLSALKPQVDTFFEDVMVNAEDEKVRANRLSLLSQLQALFNQVADISKLSV